MKYPPAPLTPFLAALPQKAPISFRSRSLISQQGTPLSAHASIACSLLNSLASLFATPSLYFQSFADSFVKTPGGGVPCANFPPLVYPERSSRGATPFLLAFVFKNLQIPPSISSINMPPPFQTVTNPSPRKLFRFTFIQIPGGVTLPGALFLVSPLVTRHSFLMLS